MTYWICAYIARKSQTEWLHGNYFIGTAHKTFPFAMMKTQIAKEAGVNPSNVTIMMTQSITQQDFEDLMSQKRDQL